MDKIFLQSPYYLVEEALDSYFQQNLALEGLLSLFATQHTRVAGWLQDVESLEPSESENSHLMREIGLKGNSLMLEGLARLHEAIQHDNEDDFYQAEEMLFEGHELIEESLTLCDLVEEEENSLVADSLDSYAF